MARHPIADDGSELSHLQGKTPVVPRRDPERIFVEPDLSAVITWIKTSIQTRLNKNINLRPNLGVEKQRQPRIEKVVNITINESGRRLFEMISLKIDRAAQAQTHLILEGRHTERGVRPVEQVISVQSARGAGQKAQAQCCNRFHATSAAAAGARCSARKR